MRIMGRASVESDERRDEDYPMEDEEKILARRLDANCPRCWQKTDGVITSTGRLLNYRTGVPRSVLRGERGLWHQAVHWSARLGRRFRREGV